jgi:hypothetical protein
MARKKVEDDEPTVRVIRCDDGTWGYALADLRPSGVDTGATVASGFPSREAAVEHAMYRDFYVYVEPDPVEELDTDNYNEG